MGLLHPRDGVPRAVEQRGVVQRGSGEQGFEVGGHGGVEMHPAPVEVQPDGRLSGAAGVERAQEGILDPQHRRVPFLGDGEAPVRRRAVAPDTDRVAGTGQAEPQAVAGELQDAAHPALGQEPAVVNEKPGALAPGHIVFRAAQRISWSGCRCWQSA